MPSPNPKASHNMNRPDGWLCSPPYSYLVVFFIAVVPRILVGALYPYIFGDWDTVYKFVAENILINHCVSQSLPSSGLCVPHWGGNQLPGFPFFAAVVWAVLGKSDWAILAGQSVLAALAICWLMHAVKEKLDPRRIFNPGRFVDGI